MESKTTSAETSLINRKVRNLQLAALGLLLLLLLCIWLWQPWRGMSGAQSRTIEVTGNATVTAKPDEFVFYPTYTFTDPVKETALANLTKKSQEVVAGLKQLGIPENKIKTDSNGANYPATYRENSKDATYTLQLTVTAANQEQAQKVSDYLVTTTPVGAISPQATFSEKKRKSLESTARDEATKEARAKADQMAKNLQFKVGKVKTISDGQGFNMPYGIREDVKSSRALSTDSLSAPAIQPGENDLSYSIKVTYYIK